MPDASGRLRVFRPILLRSGLTNRTAAGLGVGGGLRCTKKKNADQRSRVAKGRTGSRIQSVGGFAVKLFVVRVSVRRRHGFNADVCGGAVDVNRRALLFDSGFDFGQE